MLNVAIVMLVASLVLMARNLFVYLYRTKLIEHIFECNMADIEAGVKHARISHRMDEFDRVGYNQMFWQFWKPCSWFYDKKFLEEVGMK